MNGTIFALTLRQMASWRRMLIIVLLALLPVLIAVIYRLGDTDAGTSRQDFAVNVLMDAFIVTMLLPLSALVFGTAALGEEIEDGTAIYLLSKPIPRLHVVTAKLLAVWLVTVPLVLASAIVGGMIVLQGAAEKDIIMGFAVAIVLGSFVYAALFLLLSVVTSRALVAGLVYVFIWEGMITELFGGLRFLSIRQYSLGVADLVASRPSADFFDAELGGATALIMMAVVGVGAAALAVRRLCSLEISQSE